jgi:hypothetical protein
VTRRLVVAMLTVVGLFGLPSPAAARLGITDTKVAVTGLLQVRFQPGICAPGAAPLGCTASNASVPFEARTLSCTANGVFEGASLPPDAPCEDQFRGALVGNPPGSTPNCVAGARFESTGTFRIAGFKRATINRSLLRIDGSIAYQGRIADTDADAKPNAGHIAHGTLRAEQADPPPSPDTLFCVTTPLRGFVARVVLMIQ